MKTELHNTIQILELRGKQVLLDRELAQLYKAETKVLNQAVKRNLERFPEEFRFQLSKMEFDYLVTNCDRFKLLKHSSSLPYAFTEQGVAMLSAVLKSDVAIRVSIQIMNAFVQMRHKMQLSQALFSRLDQIEQRQQFTDERVNQLFEAMEQNKLPLEKGIFFEGEIFDAFAFVVSLIKQAKHQIILIDNYVDERTFVMLSNRNEKVNISIYTARLTDSNKLAAIKYREQYADISLHILRNCHDRFLIIDENLFHVGASFKDLGKKWFAFSKMNDLLPEIKRKLETIDVESF
ncbi:MAG: ORF6N domain-containing protein [Flavobacteriia bacterium]|jgi:hypothetical protein